MFNSSNEEDVESAERKPTLEEMRKELLAAQLMLMNYAIKHEYAYDRWLSGVNIIILREEGNTKVHRLRVLHLIRIGLQFVARSEMEKIDTSCS